MQITFNHDQKEYIGNLRQVSGGGSTAMFHLTIDGFYYGRLRYSDFLKLWVFDKNNLETDISYLFPKYVTDLANDGKLF